MFAGLDSIRDVIAFPKNNSGRDVMIDSPSEISPEQFKELGIQLKMENWQLKMNEFMIPVKKKRWFVRLES